MLESRKLHALCWLQESVQLVPPCALIFHLHASCSLLFRLIFRGEGADGAVLCTHDRTYDVKLAETSNLLMLMPSCMMGDELPERRDKRAVVQKEVNNYHFSCPEFSFVEQMNSSS